MAVRPKKRDRFAMTSSPASSYHPSARSPSSDRPSPGPASPSSPSPAEDEEQAEYERAVAFLAEFRSRRVASAVLHSTSLDAIVESDGHGLDEILASDFSLALQVDGREDSLGAPPSPRKTSGGVGPAGRGLVGLSGMKKVATAKCLLDLDVAPSSDVPQVARSVTPPTLLPTSEPDYRFGYEEVGPATKRLRSLACR